MGRPEEAFIGEDDGDSITSGALTRMEEGMQMVISEEPGTWCELLDAIEASPHKDELLRVLNATYFLAKGRRVVTDRDGRSWLDEEATIQDLNRMFAEMS